MASRQKLPVPEPRAVAAGVPERGAEKPQEDTAAGLGGRWHAWEQGREKSRRTLGLGVIVWGQWVASRGRKNRRSAGWGCGRWRAKLIPPAPRMMDAAAEVGGPC